MLLSLLDQSPVSEGSTASDALQNTINLAQHAERLGYHRFWVAEHHNSEGLAGSSPEIMIGAIASATETIRVGSAGVMLTHYSPYKVAENFRVLEDGKFPKLSTDFDKGGGAKATFFTTVAEYPRLRPGLHE